MQELFPQAKVASWLPDELLFSLCSRIHRLSGNWLSSSTCKLLFGHANQGCAHDFPSRIDAFVARSGNAFGRPDEIILEHTILPFFLRTRNAADQANAISAMRGNGIGTLKYSLGILTSRFRANFPLKACLQCMQQDRNNHLVAYWHVVHQLPGVWVCLKHNSLIHESTLKSTGVGRFQWFLPAESTVRNPVVGPDNSLSATTWMQLASFATAAESFARLGNDYFFDSGRLRQAYMRGLSERGLLNGERLRRDEIGGSYASFVAPFRSIREFSSLPSNANDAIVQISRLLYPPRSGTHPVRHLLAMLWVFGSWEKFWLAYEAVANPPRENSYDRPSIIVATQVAEDERRVHLVKLIQDEKLNSSAAAKRVGVSVTTAIVWAAQAGLAPAQRPKVLKEPKHKKLVALLRKGTEKQEIADSLGISVTSVTRVMRSVPGLQAAWHDVRHERARTLNRNLWLRALKKNPQAGSKTIRLIEPGAFAWLYRNDRAWLSDLAVDLKARMPAKSNNSKIDWASRDDELSRSIYDAAIIISQELPGRMIRLHQIYQRLPNLKAKLLALSRMPKSEEALKRAIKKRSR